MSERTVVWQPLPRQQRFMESWQDEVLYGGAAGGGKSEALVVEALRQADKAAYKGLILRKTFTQMGELIDKSMSYYPRAFPGCRYNSSAHTWTFPSGARIRFGHLQHETDKLQYQGQAFDFIAFDELTHFQQSEYMYLMSRNRPNAPGMRCYIRASANPGGIGHGWVKSRFVDAAQPEKTIWEKVKIKMSDGSEIKRWMSRCFIPAKVTDNPILMENDPRYIVRLASMPYAERQGLLYGDWNSFSGQVFLEWRDDPEHYLDRRWTHVIEPFRIPSWWTVYRTLDWGYARPFSVGWWAVDGDGVLYRIGELYGCTAEPNTGVKWTVERLMSEIAKHEEESEQLRGRRIIGIADPAIWQEDGGPSIASVADKYRLDFEPADNSRIPGKMQMHYRMAFDEDGYPRMYVFNTCRAFIRTVPTLVYSTVKVEDVDTSQEDHVYDEARYMCQYAPIEAREPAADSRYGENPAWYALDIPRDRLRYAGRSIRVEGKNDG